jgi:MFS family permease
MDSSSVTTESDPSEPKPVLEYEPLGERRWHAGTLTYTFAGLVALFFWLLWGDFALNLKERSVPPALQLLLKHFHASDFVLGLLVTSLPQAIGLVITPIASYRSDRHRGRWGRRIPFLLVTAPIAMFAMLGLAFSPVIGRWLAHAGLHSDRWTIVSFGVFWGVFEIASIPVNYVLFPGLINDVVPRPVLGRFYGLFRTISLAAGILFFVGAMGKVEEHYVLLFVSFGIIYAASFVIMCMMVKEGKYDAISPPVEAAVKSAPAMGEQVATGAMPQMGPATALPPASRTQNFIEGVKTYFKESFSNPYYFWFFGSFMLAQMAFTPINTFSVIFAKAVGLSMQTYGYLSGAQLALSLVQAYLIGWLCDKFHPLRVTIVSLAMYATVSLLAFLFVRGPIMFGVAHVVCGSCAGFWLTATAPLGPALLPKAKFTTFLSANHICVATGMLLVAPACGEFLDLIHSQYHYIYLWASVFMSGAVVVTLVLHRRFMDLGGPTGYVAPE